MGVRHSEGVIGSHQKPFSALSSTIIHSLLQMRATSTEKVCLDGLLSHFCVLSRLLWPLTISTCLCRVRQKRTGWMMGAIRAKTSREVGVDTKRRNELWSRHLLWGRSECSFVKSTASFCLYLNIKNIKVHTKIEINSVLAVPFASRSQMQSQQQISAFVSPSPASKLRHLSRNVSTA